MQDLSIVQKMSVAEGWELQCAGLEITSVPEIAPNPPEIITFLPELGIDVFQGQ